MSLNSYSANSQTFVQLQILTEHETKEVFLIFKLQYYH